MVHLPHVAKRYPRELSGGQQQRIALARCIVYRPVDHPDGRAARRARQEAARPDAARDQAHPPRTRHHDRLRHARSGRGDDDVGSHLPDECGRDRAARHAGGSLFPSALACSSRTFSASRICSARRCATSMRRGSTSCWPIRRSRVRVGNGSSFAAGEPDQDDGASAEPSRRGRRGRQRQAGGPAGRHHDQRQHDAALHRAGDGRYAAARRGLSHPPSAAPYEIGQLAFARLESGGRRCDPGRAGDTETMASRCARYSRGRSPGRGSRWARRSSCCSSCSWSIPSASCCCSASTTTAASRWRNTASSSRRRSMSTFSSSR